MQRFCRSVCARDSSDDDDGDDAEECTKDLRVDRDTYANTHRLAQWSTVGSVLGIMQLETASIKVQVHCERVPDGFRVQQ